MFYIYIKINQINCNLLLSQLQNEGDVNWKQITPWKLEKAFTWKLGRKKAEKKILNFANKYGVSLSISIEDSPRDLVFEVVTKLILNSTIKYFKGEKNNMYNISVKISDINYNKLASNINNILMNSSGKNTTMIEIIKIIEPFIDNTMKTIPSSAIVQLFNLLARDKVIDIAQSNGVTIKDISVGTEK